MTTTSAPAQLKPIQRYGLAIGALVFLLPFLLDIPGLDEPGERMLSIFLLAIVFWITEAIPPWPRPCRHPPGDPPDLRRRVLPWGRRP
jgi:hypothetical protein